MTRSSTRAVWMLLVVAGLLGPVALEAADGSPAQLQPAARDVSVVVSGAMTWMEPPQRFGVEGGWTVELPEPASWLDDVAAAPAGGAPPRVKVIGTRSAGTGARLVRAGGVELLVGAESIHVSSTSRRGGPRDRRPTQRAPSIMWSAGSPLAVAVQDDETRLRGYIVELAPDGFAMLAEGGMYDVVVTSQTELEGFSDLSELAPGDEVEARGQLQGTTLIASRVVLRDSGEEARLRGVVVLVSDGGLELDVDGTIISVVVTPQTELYNFGSLDELEIGDELEARGTLSGLVLTATRLEILEGGVDFEFTGLLTTLIPPDRFAMDDGRTYTVTPGTEFDPLLGGYDGLAPGQYLEVEARRGPSGANLVADIEYEGDAQGGQGYRELEGIIEAVSPLEVRLEAGPVVAITPTTRFVGDADSVAGVVPGWAAEIEALLDLTGTLRALEVRTDDRVAATTGGQSYEPQQALVVPQAGASVDSIAVRFGAEVVGRVGGLGGLLWFPEPIDDDLLAALTADPEVAAVEPNYLFQDPESVRRRYPTVDRRPTTEKLVRQEALTQVNLPPVHELVTGADVVVAVIDTGVDPLHPALRRRLLPGGLDLIDGDLTPWEERDHVDGDGDGDVDEAAGHGTFVASLIGVAAPGAMILPYRVLDDEGGGTAYDLAVALADAIERRVDVINLSLVYQERSSAVDLLLERATRLGIVVVTSAGNDAAADIPFPASDSNTLAVAALALDGLGLASFTNRSELVTIAAPGEDIFGALDEQAFGTWSGTSMAAPFVSGAAALMIDADPGLDPQLVRNGLEQSGVVLQDMGWTGMVLDALAAVTLVYGGP